MYTHIPMYIYIYTHICMIYIYICIYMCPVSLLRLSLLRFFDANSFLIPMGVRIPPLKLKDHA